MIEGNQQSALSTQQFPVTPSPLHPLTLSPDGELELVLDHDLEITPAALLVEGCS
jgi:hypothetical protein